MERIVFQPSIFRCKLAVSFREGNSPQTQNASDGEGLHISAWDLGGYRLGVGIPSQDAGSRRGKWVKVQVEIPKPKHVMSSWWSLASL